MIEIITQEKKIFTCASCGELDSPLSTIYLLRVLPNEEENSNQKNYQSLFLCAVCFSDLYNQIENHDDLKYGVGEENGNKMIKLKQNPVEDDLRVWHIPQVPMRSFLIDVKDLEEAKKILIVLAEYDEFQYNNDVKGDYSNAAGLLVYTGYEWVDWEDLDGNDIDYYIYGEGRNTAY